MEDLKALCGKRLCGSLLKVATPEIQDRLRDHTKKLSLFTRLHSKMLKEVRNSASAHRDENATIQIDIMERMDIERILNLNVDYFDWLDGLLCIVDAAIVHNCHLLTKWEKAPPPP